MPTLRECGNLVRNLMYGRITTEAPFMVQLRSIIPNPRSFGSMDAMTVRELEAPDHVPFEPWNYPPGPGYEENELQRCRVWSKVWFLFWKQDDVLWEFLRFKYMNTKTPKYDEKMEQMAQIISRSSPTLADDFRVMVAKDDEYMQKVIAYQTEGKDEMKVRKKAWDAKQKRKKQREKQAEREEELEEKQQRKEAKMKKKQERKGGA